MSNTKEEEREYVRLGSSDVKLAFLGASEDNNLIFLKENKKSKFLLENLVFFKVSKMGML